MEGKKNVPMGEHYIQMALKKEPSSVEALVEYARFWRYQKVFSPKAQEYYERVITHTSDGSYLRRRVTEEANLHPPDRNECEGLTH